MSKSKRYAEGNDWIVSFSTSFSQDARRHVGGVAFPMEKNFSPEEMFRISLNSSRSDLHSCFLAYYIPLFEFVLDIWTRDFILLCINAHRVSYYTILILILSNSFRYGKRKYTRNISISIFLIIIYFPFIFRNRKSRTNSIEMSTKYVKIPCCKRKQKKFPWKGIILTEDNGLCNFYSLKIYSF